MKLGVYFDLRNPPAWRQDPARLYGFTLEMCEEAEHLGAHSVWFSEHHLFEDGYLTQPLTFAAAAAARTRRVRVGTAILIAPLRPAVQIAEEAAIVDLVSGGRLDLGVGAGYSIPEFELFGADHANRFETLTARVREVRRLWQDERMRPRPVQDRVPVWIGFHGPVGARRAGRAGENLLAANAALWPAYRQGLIEGGHDPGTGRMFGGVQGWVTEDPEADWPVVARHLAYQYDSYQSARVAGTGKPVPPPIDPERLRSTADAQHPLQKFLYATPEEAARRIRADDGGDAPVEGVFIFASLGGMSEDMVARHVQTLCTRLRPLLEATPGSATQAPPDAAGTR